MINNDFILVDDSSKGEVRSDTARTENFVFHSSFDDPSSKFL